MKTLLKPHKRELDVWFNQQTAWNKFSCWRKVHKNTHEHIWKVAKLFQMQRQGNQWNLNEHGESHHRFKTCHEHGIYEGHKGWKF
jgi:hypothetical protein